MDLKILRVHIDALAELIDRKPNKLRLRFEKAGVTIPEDGFLDIDDAQLGLLEIHEDWEEVFGPFETKALDRSQREPRLRLYPDLAEMELDQETEYLVSPADPDRIKKLLKFLEANNAYGLKASLLSTIYGSLIYGMMSADHVSEPMCKVNYAVCRAKALLLEGNYHYASEMAFAALACGKEFAPLRRNDQRIILYVLALLLNEGVITIETDINKLT